MQHNMHPRSASVSSTGSSWSLVSEKMMTPNRTARQDSMSSTYSSKDLSPGQTQKLWEVMVDLHGQYNCYNSTRLDAALETRDQDVNLIREYMPFLCCGDMLPVLSHFQSANAHFTATSFIIDLINESVHDMPQEGWQRLHSCFGVEEQSASTGFFGRFKFWKKDRPSQIYV